ncbi:MAG: OmpA family protein [Pirellulales bacterium]|nr:OmpA family protein [Pirellulales bacterium]
MSRLTILATLAAISLAAGCQWVPKSQLAASENGNRDLVEKTRAQAAEIEHLKADRRQLEDRLATAETDLAAIAGRAGLDRKTLAGLRSGAGLVPAGVGRDLAELAARYPALNFDPATGVSKLDIDVLFDTAESQLKPEALRLLDDFADVMSSPEASRLRLMVVGHTDDRLVGKKETRERYRDNWHLSTARALAVSEYLRHRGISPDRLGVAGFADQQPIASSGEEAGRERNRRVEIFVMAPETPVVGWVDTMAPLYR